MKTNIKNGSNYSRLIEEGHFLLLLSQERTHEKGLQNSKARQKKNKA